MSTKKRKYSSPAKSRSESRKHDHLRYLELIEGLQFGETCCEICHCDCYMSLWETEKRINEECYKHENSTNSKRDNNNINCNGKKSFNKLKGTKKKNVHIKGSTLQTSKEIVKRSKSACSDRSPSGISTNFSCCVRDCKILKELSASFDELPQVNVACLGSNKTPEAVKENLPPAPSLSLSNEKSIELCDSMANLCLSPTVRRAFETVPLHDKKILNRMAKSRNDKAVASDNAWLARKYWENERYERELIKCEEMEEYKKAIKDKQFQDYILTRARLNEIAHRDLTELQLLRDSIRQKDERVKRRLDIIQVERGMKQCQRKCDELKKNEAVLIIQEDQQIGEAMRKETICQNREERLQKAEIARSQMLDKYLKRLRYDNFIEQLLHEENRRESQQFDQMKRDDLKERISRKKVRTERFAQKKRNRNNEMKQRARISSNLRDLVRNSVTPDGATGGVVGFGLNTIGRMIFDRSNYSIY